MFLLFYHFIRDAGIVVSSAVACFPFYLDGLLRTELYAGHALLAAMFPYRLSANDLNVVNGTYRRADTAGGATVIYSEQGILFIKVLFPFFMHDSGKGTG